MQNLNQIRACHVMKFAKAFTIQGENGGEVIKKIPPVIMNNGLMPALAYSLEVKVKKDKETEKQIEKYHSWRPVFDAIARHLSSKEIALIPEDKNSAEELLCYLANEASCIELRNITAEVGEWLNFARRLVK